jgi:hypothetical protein
VALPTSPTWNLADFSGIAFSEMLYLSDDDLVAIPSLDPYYAYNDSETIVEIRSNAGVEASLLFDTPVSSRFTLDLLLRCPQLPHNLGDLHSRRFGLTVANDAGRGFTLYLAKTGVAISRVDNYGAATALPDTSDVTQAVATSFFTVRIAIDSGLGRAYIFTAEGETETPALRWIIPVEATPEGVGDTFKVFAKGLPNEPVFVELARLRLASDLVLANYPPVADAGPDRVAPIGSAVRFDGRASYDVEGAMLRYRWQCIDAPYTSTYAAEISGVSSSDDGDGDGVTTAVRVNPLMLPDWLSPGDIARIEGHAYEVLIVDTTTGLVELTSDDVPDDLSSAPIRFIRQSVLLDTDSPTPVAVPDIPGLYRFRPTVNDGEDDSEPSEVLANITALQTPTGVEPDVSVLWKAIGDEWRYIDGRDVFEEAWIGVTQILAGKLLEAWQHHYNTSIRDAQQVFQRKWIGYSTTIPESAPDQALISVRHGGFSAAHRFEDSYANLADTELVIEVLQATGEVSSIVVPFVGVDGGYFGSLSVVTSAINARVGASGVVAEMRGTRSGTALTRYDLLVSTPATGTSANLAGGALWPAAVGDVLCVAGGRYTVQAMPGGAPQFSALPRNLPEQPAALYKMVRLVLHGTVPFRLRGSACPILGLPVGDWNTLGGLSGVRVTDRAYYVEGVDLTSAGIQRGDLLVVNNGESFQIDRVLDDPLDPHPNQRVLLFERTPADTTAAWRIPSVIKSAEVDYERAGVYPGDLAKAEIFTEATGQVTIANSHVVAQKERQLAVDLGMETQAALLAGKEVRFVGVKRRKALPLPDDVLSVPTLQELIAERLVPTRYREHVDYVLEPFYRDVGGRPVPMLQFADSVFIEPDLEPADVLWAETTLFDNEGHVEDLFGRLVGFLRDDAATFPKDFNYVAGVAGLLYAQQRGPSLFAMAVGAQILLGQPFAEVAGYIEEIRANYSPRQGRILVRDADGNSPTESDTVRAYYYTKRPSDLGANSGLAINPETNAPWQVAEYVPQFSALGAGIDIEDVYTKPRWWTTYVGSDSMYEIEKFHRFVCTFDLALVDIANINLLSSLLTRIRPTYTRGLLVGAESTADDLDIDDAVSLTNTLLPFDSLFGEYGYRYDDYKGDGTISHTYDDNNGRRFDALIDSIVDLVSFEVTVAWPGGALNFPTAWPFLLGSPVVDVDGAETGSAGASFSLADGMDLAAGTYRTTLPIKTGPVLPPL